MRVSHFSTKFALLTIFMVFCFPSISNAACSNPAGDVGDTIYNTTHNVVQYCDGTNWIGWGPANSGAGAGGCSNPAGG